MQYNSLGNSGLEVSSVSLGCMSLKNADVNAENIIRKAADSGINLFDTADLYGKGENEILLGKALKGIRNGVLISTKVGNRWKDDGSGWEWCPRKSYILKAADESLKRLQTDCIDLYLLHGGTIEDPVDECIEAFERLKEQGKIRAYGISSIRPNVIREYVNRSEISAVMTQYSLLDRRPEEATLELLNQNNIGVLARGTIAGGLLVNKPAKDYLEHSQDEISQMLEKFSGIFKDECERQRAAIGYALANPAVTSAVAGIRTESQLDLGLKAAQTQPLSPNDLQVLKQLFPAKPYRENR
ncbi:D-threo-aldose 1-dehydrogenase [Flavobacterium noncentrifugens]|uniref:Predicted oxidoreductase n=1 Tax=Flavobacterium noncentrifugens TaxID=1128970 RepID=A0A1G8WQ92_9FLAO|nr:aldo/keto reductase [Flavobacterium noncentrifugens]GEP51019.1 D-threo-aldose 1-dehydrogenase [Flavobacterium noncentrifugens]SDJ80542.1 Predicted oxidoreductase [Flavobacterium noncentrifugens]